MNIRGWSLFLAWVEGGNVTIRFLVIEFLCQLCIKYSVETARFCQAQQSVHAISSNSISRKQSLFGHNCNKC